MVFEREDLMQLASPLFHVHPGVPPFQIVHGTLDETVPFAQAERLATVLKAAGNEVDFLSIAGAYHNLSLEEMLPWTDNPWEALGWKALAFFQRHLCQ
jgi:dipeptidyl aminopeptidase/acylaminoacyl peptidase